MYFSRPFTGAVGEGMPYLVDNKEGVGVLRKTCLQGFEIEDAGAGGDEGCREASRD